MIGHRVLKWIIKRQQKHTFLILNSPPYINENCIYAVNHSCKWDFQYMVEIAHKNFYVLAGKQRLKIIDRIAFTWNGTIWVDRKNKNSKSLSKKKMRKVLKRGKSLLIFPEGTWNLTPSTPVLPLYWGIIEIAKSEKVPIIPICMEYVENKCIIKYGDILNIADNEDKKIAVDKLRDIFATLKWDIWENYEVGRRSDVVNEFWEREVERRINEYKLFDYKYEMSCVRKI